MRPRRTASSELTIVSPSRGHAFTSTGAEPVAITISLAEIRSLPSSRFTAISVGDTNDASPRTNSTPLALKSVFTPLTFALTTSVLNFATASRSTSAFATFRPIAPACSMWRITSPTWSSALVGMQPQLRQTPPTSSRSMQTTFLPSCARRMAA